METAEHWTLASLEFQRQVSTLRYICARTNSKGDLTSSIQLKVDISDMPIFHFVVDYCFSEDIFTASFISLHKKLLV